MKSSILHGGQVVRRVPFDESYRERSAVWLQDPEIVRLIRAPQFDPDAQRAWFDGLAGRTDYVIWGIECDGVPIGAFGLRDIGLDDGGVYFIHLGERAYWHLGIGRWALGIVKDEVVSRGLTWVHGSIGHDNERARAAQFRLGFRSVREEADETFVALRAADPFPE